MARGKVPGIAVPDAMRYGERRHHRRRGMRLTERLFLLVAVAMLPALAIQAYNEFDLRRSRKAEVRRLAEQQAYLAASELAQIVAGVGAVLTAVSEVPAVRSLAPEQCGDFLRDLQLRVPHLAAIGVIDLNGRLACRNTALPPDLHLGDRGYFTAALTKDGPVVGEYTVSAVDQTAILPVALAMRDRQGKPLGVVAAGLDLAWLSRHLGERSLTEGDSVTIADRQGTILARAPLPERFVGTRIPEAFQHLLAEDRPGAMEVKSQDGTRRMLGYIPVNRAPAPGMYVSAGIAADRAFAAIDRATQRGLALILLGLLLALATAWLMGRWFLLQPMGQLLAAADRWRTGDFAGRTGLSGSGEFAELGVAFDRMAAALAEREQERDQALGTARESEARLRAVVESLPFEFWVIDRAGRYVLQNSASRAHWGHRVGQRPEETDTPPEILAAWLENNRRALAGEIVRTEQHWRRDGAIQHVEKIVAPIVAGERVLGAVGINIDVTERHEAAERQRLLVAELNHRVRNMLATIGAIVRLTLTGNRPLDDARDVLRDRLDALASTYNLLTENQWRGAALQRIAANELRPYGGRARVRGIDVTLSPQAAQTVGMILHELATNAAKHGAFSTLEGQVDLDFALRPAPDGDVLEVVWSESGGPPVEPGARRGFGRSVLEDTAVRQLKAKAEVEFRETGLVYRLQAPMAVITARPAPSDQS